MSAPPNGKGEPVTGKRELVEYLAQGCKPRAAWRIGTEHEKFGFTREDLRPLPYEGPRGIRALAGRPGRPLRLAARARERQPDRARQAGLQHQSRARRPARAQRGAPGDPAPDLLRGAHAPGRGEEDRRAVARRHAGHGVPAQVAARGHALDAEGPLRDHGRLHAQGRQAGAGHDAAHLHRAGEPGLRVRGRHGPQVPESAWRYSRSPPPCSRTRPSSRTSRWVT